MSAISDGRAIKAAIKRARDTAREVIAGAGQNLYLRVGPGGAARWVVIKHMDGRNRERALGAYPDLSLAQARDKVPGMLAAMRRSVAREAAPAIPSKFGKFADWYFNEQHRPGLSSAKSVQMWEIILASHLHPLRALQVRKIEPHHVAAILRPLSDRPAMMRDVRGKLAIILNAARALGLTDGNAAEWDTIKFHIPGATARGRKSYRPDPHGALEFEHMPGLVRYLRDLDTPASACLEWLILTTTRSAEARGTSLAEIDRARGIWTIAPDRMKRGLVHRVPLCARAMELVTAAAAGRSSGLLFPGRNGVKPLSGQTLRDMLFRYECHELGREKPAATVHGFRATFASWGQRSGFPDEILDRQLAHVADAYLRDDVLDIRLGILQRWQTALNKV